MAEDIVLLADKVSRHFDVSRPWLQRTLAREPKMLLRAVDGISFRVARGSTLSLVGESGCGKSTVARLAVGLYTPSGGEIRFEGENISAARAQPDLRRRMNMIFQDPYASLNPRWRVRDIVAEPIRAFKLLSSNADINARVGALLTQVGLAPADGEKLQQRLGLTYLFISHNLSVVRHMSDRLGVMYLGRIVEIGPAEAIFGTPRHPYTKLLLDAIPDLDMVGRARTPVGGEVPSPINPPPGCPFHPRCPLANARCKVEKPEVIRLDTVEIACHAAEEGRTTV